TTKNPYGNNVNLDLFTSPASDVLVNKLVGRIGGTGQENEVYSPVVSFRTPSANSVYRVTALLSRYDSEAAKTPSALAVTGQGSGIRVHTTSSDDYLYSGTGTSSFGPFSTDANTFYARVTTRPISYTLLGGSSLTYSGSAFLQMDAGIDYVSATEKSDRISMETRSGAAGATITLSQMPEDVVGVNRDGAVYGAWTNTSTTLTITPGLGEHEIDVLWVPVPNRPPVMAQIGDKSVAAGSLLTFAVSATDPDGNVLSYSASGLPSGANFDTTTETFSWTPSASQIGTYQVVFTASDGSLSDDETITVTVTATAPTATPTPSGGAYSAMSGGGGESNGGGVEEPSAVVGETTAPTSPPRTPAVTETMIQPAVKPAVQTTAARITPTVSRIKVPAGLPQSGFLAIQAEFLIEMVHRSESFPGVTLGIELLKRWLNWLGW
ncbi:MAG TPA: putative Ig domain-containing protein, partial [Methanomicrobiales archaeon]|nr:putative Ig domain-containing protein [Methanomicrobiales archaeon]